MFNTSLKVVTKKVDQGVKIKSLKFTIKKSKINRKNKSITVNKRMFTVDQKITGTKSC